MLESVELFIFITIHLVVFLRRRIVCDFSCTVASQSKQLAGLIYLETTEIP